MSGQGQPGRAAPLALPWLPRGGQSSWAASALAAQQGRKGPFLPNADSAAVQSGRRASPLGGPGLCEEHAAAWAAPIHPPTHRSQISIVL